jgi:crossover junction endodeoxyribonuclease RusA
VIITLPLPHKNLSPNARVHHMAKARHTQKARLDAYLATVDAANRSGVMVAPKWKKATAKATFYFRTKNRRDKSNMAGWLKAYEDGITDAGAWSDDSVVTWLPPSIDGIDPKNPRVEIEVVQSVNG